jgi:CRP-like cAMP-binding protein
MLNCLKARIARFKKGGYILNAGEETRSIGIMLSGQAAVYKDDILGNRSVLTILHPADMFAESFLCAGITTSPVTVEAGADSDVLLIPFEKILRTCSSSCEYHNSLIENMLGIIARKNLALSDKIDHVSKRTTKRKLASYLLVQAGKNGEEFSIALDRQGLADYLCVNRSALSRELSKIAEEGVLSFHKDRFKILDFEGLEAILYTE